ncbi:major facilitator superfamily transporter [Apiospora aurea]|uniref:Major facilitator superfamily transporter n=1 Tax=Apiospora aurea TaxID=335848 RepID=A0ABR1QV62_9PEZI
MAYPRESHWSASTDDNSQSEIYGNFDPSRDRRYNHSLSIYPEDESNPDIDTIPIGLPAVPHFHHEEHPYYRTGSTCRTSGNRIWQLPREASIEPLELKRPVANDQPRWSVLSEEPGDDGMSKLHEFFFVTTVCMAQLCTQAGLGQTLAIIHVIGSTWGITNPSELSWLIAGYTLTIGTFILIAGRLGDVYGYKRVFLSGFLWSALWACLAGAAYYSGPVLFTVCRVLQGMGAAMCLPNAIALLGTAYPPGRKKSLVFSAFAAMAPCGSIIVAYWAFSFTLCIIATIGYYAIPSATNKTERPHTFRGWLVELDIPGATAGVSSLVLVNFAFNQGHISGWNEPSIWEALIVGGVLMCIFIMIECHYAKNPIVPLNALSPQVSLILGAVACGWACFGIWSFYTWQFLQIIKGLSPLLTTGWMSPIVAMGIFASMTTGMALHKLGPPVAMLISMLAFTVSTALIATVPEDQTYWGQTFVGMLVISWGMDMSFPAATLLLSNSVSKKHQGIAASLVATVINYSMSIGIGIGGTVEAQVTRGAVTKERVLSGYRAALLTGVGLAGTGAVICIALIVGTKLPAVIERQRTKRSEAATMKREKEMATPCYSCQSCRQGGSTRMGSQAGSSVAWAS